LKKQARKKMSEYGPPSRSFAKEELAPRFSTIRISTILKFLFGERQSIYAVASNRWSLLVGFLFVIIAGIAREYDGEYLVAEPWHLILPLSASLIGCSFLVLLLIVLSRARKVRDVSIVETFLCFLSVYWMTAPLALVYGIPFERFLSPDTATKANLWLLAIVAAWRVLLTIRCVMVIYGCSFGGATTPVMLFSVILAMLGLALVPGPIFMMMGGVRLTESESLILETRAMIFLFCYGTVLFWVIGYIMLLYRKTPWSYYRSRLKFESEMRPVYSVSRNVWAFACLAVLPWLCYLPITQSEQFLRWKSEQLIEQEDYESLSKLTIENPQSNFPPHWDPPPRLSYGDTEPKAYQVINGLLDHQAADWMTDIFSKKLQHESESWWMGFRELEDPSNEPLSEFVRCLVRIENGSKIANEIRLDYVEPHPTDDERNELVERIRGLQTQSEHESND
jgi:hypothetical protein